MKERVRARNVINDLCKRENCNLEELLEKVKSGKVHVFAHVHLQLKKMISEQKKEVKNYDL